MKDKLTIVLTATKVLISIVITYLILMKGDAGVLIHNIGAFFVGGSYIVGLSSIASATLFYALAMYNLTINYTQLKKLKQIFLIFDIALVIINLVLGVFIATEFNQMPFDDAISKFIILATGSALIYYAMGVLVMLLISKLQPNLQASIQPSVTTSNNPFVFTGRIARKPYLITKSLMMAIFVGTIGVKSSIPAEYSFTLTAILTFITFSVGLIAASKRLRDINWSQLFLLIWAIPFLGLVIGIPLLFIKSKRADN